MQCRKKKQCLEYVAKRLTYYDNCTYSDVPCIYMKLCIDWLK